MLKNNNFLKKSKGIKKIRLQTVNSKKNNSKPTEIEKQKTITQKINFSLKIFFFFFMALIFTIILIFVPAGSINYWQGWLFIAVLFTPVTLILRYFLKHDSGLLERRLAFNEKKSQQKLIVKLASLFLLSGVIVAGLDFRFNWSNIPFWIVIFANLIIFLSYLFIFQIFKENSYTSRIIEVQKKQKLITTGPYALVRHPMYLGIITLYFFIPFALGSYFALPFFVASIIVILFRTLDEEKTLEKELKGYKEYEKKTKYRIWPFVW